MTITAIDPKTAFIAVDLQNGIVSYPTVHPVAGIIDRAALLAKAFRAHALPVVLVNAAGGAPGRADQTRRIGDLPPGWTEFVPALGEEPSDLKVTKRTWGAFTNTGLDAKLKERGVTQVVLAGVATSIGVESTARQAHELGYNVTLAIDAMTDVNPDAHRNSVERIFPRLGESGTTQDIIAKLGDAARPATITLENA